MSIIKQKHLHMWVKGNPSEEDFLRTPTPHFDFNTVSLEERKEVVDHMEKMMRSHHGIGLSANQVGLPFRIFIARLPGDGEQYEGPLYVFFNPSVKKKSFMKEWAEEGCLSIPGVYGEIKRCKEVVIKGKDVSGEDIEISAEGLLARIFQHELDHLNGILFTDKARNVVMRR